MNPDEILDAAAQSLINRRCRDAALHEVRGGLQAMYSALELLSRAAKSGAGDAALTERAIGIARRAMANFEPTMLRTIEALTTHREAEGRVNVGEVAQEVLRFLRTDIANKQLVVATAIADDTELRGRRNAVRLWILGIIVTSLDAATPGGPLAVEIARGANGIDLKVRSRPGVVMRADDVVLAAVRAWAETAGGRFELLTLSDSGVTEQEIRISHP